MFRNHLKLVFRRLRKERLFTFVNIFGLTIGLTAFLLISLYVRDELSYDQFHSNKENIYRVISEYEKRGVSGMIASDFVEFFSEDIPEIKSYTRISAVGGEYSLVSNNDKRLNTKGVFFVDQNFFDFFSFELLNSPASGSFSESGSGIITESLSKKVFGDENPIGQLVEINKGEKYIISAIAKDPPSNSTIQFELLLFKQGLFKNDFERMHGIKTVVTYLSILPEHEKEIIARKIMAAREKPIYSRFTKENEYSLLSLTDQRLKAPYERDFFAKNDMRYVMLFSGIGLVVLVLALINYINLVTAQSIKRKKEFGLRKVIGADRKHLIFYQLIESTMITMISFLFAFAAAERLIPTFNDLLEKDISLQYLSSDFFIWVLLAGLLLGLVSGIYPAFNIARVKPLSLLNEKTNSARGSNWFRKGLVLFQFITTAILISVLMIINGQMKFLKEKELGYNTDFLITIPLDRDSTHLYKVLKQEIWTVSGVQSTSLNGFRVGGSWTTSVMDKPNVQGEGAKGVARDVIYGDNDLIKAMGINFYWRSNSYESRAFGENKMLINYSLAKKLEWLDNPEGKRLYGWNDQKGKEVVGIVNDFHMKSLKDEIQPMVIYSLGKWGTSNLLVRLEGSMGGNTMSQIGDIYVGMFDRPFEFDFLDDQVKAFYKKEQGQFKLFQIFSSLAIFISLLGLVALTIYMIELRRKEVSIRKVLGASVQRLILMLNREYTILVVVAFLIASPIAYYAMQDWLAAFKYRIEISPMLFVGGFLGFLAMCWMVSIFQSLKVSGENPADVLREE